MYQFKDFADRTIMYQFTDFADRPIMYQFTDFKDMTNYVSVHRFCR